jgi:integrase
MISGSSRRLMERGAAQKVAARTKRPLEAGLRDRTLLLVGFGGALRRSELVALDVADIEETEPGLLVKIRGSKTDQERVGVAIAIAHGDGDPKEAEKKAWQRNFREARNTGLIGGETVDGQELIWIAAS